MASGGLFSRSLLPPHIHNQAIPSAQQPLDSLFVSSSPSTFLGTRSMVCFEDVNGCRRQLVPFVQEEHGEEEAEEYLQQPEKKRRLTPDQVQFLERSFETENKLEPDRKIQLAKDLSLQPRQVAIWFQNRRARWKTKQLEKDYDSLQLNYNSLMADYEALLHEKDKLKSELVVLTKKLTKAVENDGGGVEVSDVDGESHITHDMPRLDPGGGYDEEGSGAVDPLNGFENEHSDLSQDEDEDARKFEAPPPYGQLRADDPGYSIPLVGPTGFGYPMEDNQALWFWTY